MLFLLDSMKRNSSSRDSFACGAKWGLRDSTALKKLLPIFFCIASTLRLSEGLFPALTTAFTPAFFAFSMTWGRSLSKAGYSRWQCESIIFFSKLFFYPNGF